MGLFLNTFPLLFYVFKKLFFNFNIYKGLKIKLTILKRFSELQNLLVIDIETASATSEFEELDERIKPWWEKKARRFDPEKSPEEVFKAKAGILAEFGKIITIGLGYFHLNEEKEVCFRVKTISGDDEKEILEGFKKLIEERFDKSKLQLVAHNGKEFDFPFLCRRLLINGIPLPQVLDLIGKKPWEIPHFDTMAMWKFGELRHYIALDLLAALLNIESSKSDIDGSKVNETYYVDQDIARIEEYCKNDVIVTAKIFLKLRSLPDLKEENIIKIK